MTNPRVNVSWQEGAPPPDLSEAELIAVVKGFLRGLGQGHCAVNLLFADDAALQELNARYRGISAPTDILSFSYREHQVEPGLLGEMALSLERSRTQARENGWEHGTEVLRLLAHGCAHLAGYDHETAPEERKMRAVEIELLNEAGLRNLYPDG